MLMQDLCTTLVALTITYATHCLLPPCSPAGDAMNSAARMQTNGKAMCIHIGHTTAEVGWAQCQAHADFYLVSKCL
jgi:hypothetical protein